MVKNNIFFLPLRSKSMILHIFNPEHDLALASNLANFTAPHAGRQLRSDLGFLPALWAEEGDYVFVENVDQARKAYGRLRVRTGGVQCQFVDKYTLRQLPIDAVEPWGWDLALRSCLLRYGVECVPTEEEISLIRDLSHRRCAIKLLSALMPMASDVLQMPVVCTTQESVDEMLAKFHRVVIKAPWSSSGRGVRFVEGKISTYHEGWIRHVIERQGSVIVEPYYHKVKDFGMEFYSDGMGHVRYLGLSLFHTRNGAYTGNIIATEDEKMGMLSRYVPDSFLLDIRENIQNGFGRLYGSRYRGPFGVDMMIISTPRQDGFLLHPCVEINLRRTMGHVALSIPPFADGFPRVMQIALTDKYRLRIRKP